VTTTVAQTAMAGSATRSENRPSVLERWRRFAWIAIVVSDAGFLAWGAMAALAPQYLPGPHGTPIVIAGYEGFTQGSWSELIATSPATAGFIELLFRLFGALCATAGLLGVVIAATAFRRNERWAWWALLVGNTLAYGAPMAYDRIVNAIGLFEMTEYLGIGVVYVALALTASAAAQRRKPN
jgi:hypothetical protein